MKKSLLIVISFLFAVNIHAQQTYDMPLKDGKIVYQEVGKEEGTPKELFDRAFEFFKDYFPNFSSAITKKDTAAKEIEGRIRIDLKTTDKKGRVSNAGKVRCDFKVECKDGKYRITISNFRKNDNSGNMLEEWFKDTNEAKVAIRKQHFEQIDIAVKDFIKKFQEGMKAKEEEDDSW